MLLFEVINLVRFTCSHPLAVGPAPICLVVCHEIAFCSDPTWQRLGGSLVTIAAPHHAKALLGGSRGIVQCDGYGAYKTLAAGNHGITLAFCWSHARRESIELARGKTAPVAAETLQRIAALYAVETELRGKPPDLCRAGRQERSRPLVEDLFAWLSAQLPRLPGGRPTAGAIRYVLNHRDGLVRFLDDGRVELDNNTVERAIRPICLSRKNALFASGDEGGARWAAVASLVETGKLNGVDPQNYFTEVLTRLVNGWPNGHFDELMPGRWTDRESD